MPSYQYSSARSEHQKRTWQEVVLMYSNVFQGCISIEHWDKSNSPFSSEHLMSFLYFSSPEVLKGMHLQLNTWVGRMLTTRIWVPCQEISITARVIFYGKWFLSFAVTRAAKLRLSRSMRPGQNCVPALFKVVFSLAVSWVPFTVIPKRYNHIINSRHPPPFTELRCVVIHLWQ